MVEFLREVSAALLDSSGCDAVELRLRIATDCFRWEARRRPSESYHHETIPPLQDGQHALHFADDSLCERLCQDVALGRGDRSLACFTRNGSFWTGDADALVFSPPGPAQADRGGRSGFEAGHQSLVIILLEMEGQNSGLLLLKSGRRYFFAKRHVQFYEVTAQMLGIAIANRRVQRALRERVKELTCLYGIAELVATPGISLEEILKGIVRLLPPAMQYPKNTFGRITLDERTVETPHFPEAGPRLSSAIRVLGKTRGSVEVAYDRVPGGLEASVFLQEETYLLNAVARQTAAIVARRESEESHRKLEEQLRHADRLATIGQLAAGVAHELNEPLTSVLGFAQLASKTAELPAGTSRDLEKIANAALHAREVVRKLLVFAHQAPTRKSKADLNAIVREGLYFLESRCANEGIEVVRVLAPDLPHVIADEAQLQQVLVNLAVNAIQAMPRGGRLTVSTRALEKERVALLVEDTGTGMSEEVMKKIFTPFFTTKDVGQGTGLGLAVVHGIVTSHGGEIAAQSEVGRGSRFEVRLPVGGAREQEGD